MPKISYEWTTTPSGNTFWGPEGGAGMLFHHPETNTYLLGHRSPEVHHGNTWGIPGGALEPGESPYQGALREAEEEFGQVPQHKVVNEHVAKPDPDWKYHTFTADVPQQFDPEYAGDWETQGHGWFTPEEINKLPLHPGFANSWFSGGLTKQAKHGFFYHTAPSEYRQQIEQNGLVPTDEAPESPWADKSGPQREQQPHGVYMWDDPENAKGYAYHLDSRANGGEYSGEMEDQGFDDSVFESPEYEDYMSKYKGEPHTDDYYDYESQFEPPRKPLYDVWKVNTLGYNPMIDPEMAIHHGELTAEEAQQQINDQGTKDWKGNPQEYNPEGIERQEGHRWYVPHTIEPARLTLHQTMYPEDMTENNWEDTDTESKKVPNAWHQVPLDQWNQKAQERYLGDPNVMRPVDPQDRTY
jgi:8-oxo-dGTP diphosphatase